MQHMQILEIAHPGTEPLASCCEQYRGYRIEGERVGCQWHIRAWPTSPDLPILGRYSFTAPSLLWTEATAEPRRQIDRLLSL